MPARDVSCHWRTLIAVGGEDAVVSDNAILWLSQIWMAIKAGIEKGHSHATTGKALVGLQSQGRGEHVTGLLEHCCMSFKLRLGPAEQFQTMRADVRQRLQRWRICFNNGL